MPKPYIYTLLAEASRLPGKLFETIDVLLSICSYNSALNVLQTFNSTLERDCSEYVVDTVSDHRSSWSVLAEDFSYPGVRTTTHDINMQLVRFTGDRGLVMEIGIGVSHPARRILVWEEWRSYEAGSEA